MLTSIRKNAGNWFTRIFMFILVLSFGVWGVADFITSSVEPPLARVAGTTVSAQEFNNDFRRELFRLQQQFGPEFSTARAREMGFDREVLRQMLVGIMFDREAESLSLTTADQTIAQSIRENPSFRDSFGGFDRNLFQRALNENGFSEKEYLRRARMDLTRRQLIAAVSSGVVAPKKVAEALYTLREEQRIAELLFVPQNAAGKISAPTDGDLEAFHNANASLFTAPETRAVSYVTLQPEDLAETILLDEQDLHEQYDARLAEFTVTAMRNLQQFVLPDEAVANAASDKIKAGQDFVAVAKQTSGMNEKEMELLEVTRGQLPAEISDAVFALKEGEISEPLKSPLGWHLVKVTAARYERVQPFEEVREKIAKDLAEIRATDLAITRANQLEDARAGGASLEEAAREFELKLHVIAGIDRNGNGPDGKPVRNFPADPQFIADVFDTDAGSESDLRENKDGGYYVLRVDSINPSAVRALADVRNEVTAAWYAQKTGEKLDAMADEMLKSAQAGKALAEIAKPLTLKVTQSAPFGRGFSDEQMSAALTTKLFTGKPGDSFAGPAPKGGYVIARLSEIKPPPLSENGDAVAQMVRDLSKSFSEDVLAQYQSVLERRYEVEVNHNVLASLFEEQ
ncbi:MAG: peptidyl-prolyl cis-trans isomerase [Alphaproteobacteria bacterium]|nr:peptidyl-prolyl cis-trans isomerase [Alphaproteobacteria bacterium]